MMNNLNFKLIASALILFVWGFFLHDPLGIFEKNYASADKFFPFESLNELKKIEVYYGKKKDKEFILKKGQWFLEFKNDDKDELTSYRADSKVLDEKIQKLGKIKKYHEITSDKKKFEEYQVSAKDLSLIIIDENEKKYKIYLGKNGATYNSTLIRLDGEDDIYSVRGSLREDWRSDLNSYRDKKAFLVHKDNIHQIIFSGKNRYRLEKMEDKTWKVVWGITESNANENQVKSLLNTIESLQGASFLDKKVNRLYAKLILMLNNNIEKEMNVYQINKNEFAFQTSDNPYLMKIPEYQINNLFIPIEEIKATTNSKSNNKIESKP